MGIQTTIIAAEEDETAAVGESSNPLNEWSGIDGRGIDTAKIATLHCLLTGDSLHLAFDLYEPAYVAEENAVVLRIADEVMEKLAAFDDEALEEVANELAASEEFETEHADPEEVLALLIELADLARLAESQGQALFVWMQLQAS